jgi:type VI secretion system protein ImpJ
MRGKLARVHWQMGQTLLPEHFIAQEEALLHETVLRFRVQGLPAHGIASLRWNESLLSEGVVSIQAATVIFPTGMLVDIPGNAVAAPLNLNVPGTAHVSVYLHCLEEAASEEEKASGWTVGEEDGVPRRVFQVAVSSEQSYTNALETMKLAEFEKSPEGVWRLSGRYVPPLLQLGTTPFLQSALAELPKVLEAFQYKLAMDSASYLSGGSLFNVKQCLKSVYRFQRFLANLEGQVHLHPYLVYEVLKDFYVEVCFYRDSSPKHVADPYNHDQLADCFNKILEPLKEQMQLAEERSPYLPFQFRDGVFRIELPDEVKQAKDAYFLIQKNQVNKVIDLRDFKMGAPSRLSMIHKLALKGIPIEKVDRPMLAHSFGPEVEFYQLIKGEEWDRALREGAAAFYHCAGFQEFEFYLYWSVS